MLARHLFLLLLIPLNGIAQKWNEMPPLPVSPRDDGSAFCLNGTVYIGLGYDETWNLNNDFYSFSNGLWKKMKDFPGGKRQYAASAATKENGYILGGYSAQGKHNDFYRFNPDSGEWSILPPLPGAIRSKHFLIASSNYLLAGTGEGENGLLNDIYLYHPQTDKWKAVDSLPGEPRKFAIAFSVLDQFYVGFGENDTGFANDFYRLDQNTNSWISVSTSIDLKRTRATSFSDGRFGYMGFGTDGNDKFYRDLWKFDPSSQEWLQLENLPDKGRRGTCGCIAKNKLFIALGLEEGYKRTNTSFRLDLSFSHSIHTFPNPVRNQIKITSDRDLTIQLFNLNGQLVLQQNTHFPFDQIDVSQLPSGVYTLKGSDSYFSKLVIVH